VGCCLVFLLAAAAQAQPVDLRGEWIDSQGNRFVLSESAGEVSLVHDEQLWQFVARDTRLRAELRLKGRQTGNELHLEQVTTRGPLVFNARLGAGGFLRAAIDVPGFAQPVDFILARPRPGEFAPARPERVAIRILKQSTEIGRWVPVEVMLASADGVPVIPQRDTEVRLSAAGGRPVPEVVKLTRAAPWAPAGVVLDSAGVEISAAAQGLDAARASADGCRAGEIDRIGVIVPAARAPADGRHSLGLKITFLDKENRLVTNGFPKPIGWRLEGVGMLRSLPDAKGRPQDTAVASDECVSRNEVISREAGTAVVTATFRGTTETATLHFIAPLSAGLILFVVFGAVCGGAVSALQNYKAAARWGARRWTAWLLSGAAGGLCLYLAYYYGVLKALPSFPSGAGFGYLAGLVGGFLGSSALARVADVVLPARRSAAAPE
jgi:hypothetical protein